MVDTLTPAQRKFCMSRVRGKDTKPEMVVRRLVHGLGFRYRIHSRRLPGRPDLVLTRHKVVIFVNGCFWHQHPECRKAKRPETRVDYWNAKLDGNVARDLRNIEALESDDWRVLVVWECETKTRETLVGRIVGFLTAASAADGQTCATVNP